jgi:hypothetical protein
MTTSRILIGNDAIGLESVYNINNSVRLNTFSKLAPTTCRAYAHELYITRLGVDRLRLQSAIGSPTLRANCSYSNAK